MTSHSDLEMVVRISFYSLLETSKGKKKLMEKLSKYYNFILWSAFQVQAFVFIQGSRAKEVAEYVDKPRVSTLATSS